MIFVPNATPPGLSGQQMRWRRALGAGYVVLGVLWIIRSVIGTTKISYVNVGIGLVWILGGACWFWGVARWRRRAERSNGH